MRFLLILVWLFCSVTHADILQGQEKEGYFYPNFQAWRIVEARRLAPASVQSDLLGIPTIMAGSLLFFSNNYFTMKSPNSGGDMIFPACFIQDETGIQAHVVDEKAQSSLGEYVNFNVGKKGIVYFSLAGKFLFGLVPESKFDASQRPKFEEVIEKLQDMNAQGEVIKDIEKRYANNPEFLAKLPKIKLHLATLLQKGECQFIEPKKVVEVKPKSLKIIFPQLNKKMIVPDGLVDINKSIQLDGGVTRHKSPRSTEYIRRSSCVSDMFFSDYTDGSTTSFITRGFMGSSDEAVQAKSVIQSERWKQWFATYFQLQGLMLKVEDVGMGDVFNKYARSTCHRELYRKRLDLPQILSQFNGFEGFFYDNQTLSVQSDSWQTDDLLMLKSKRFKLSIYDSASDELTITMEYPLVKP